jgi:hypothetical protein
MNLSTIKAQNLRTLVLQATALSGTSTWSTSANSWTPFYLNNIKVPSPAITSIPYPDIYYSNVSLWLTMDGLNASTTFTDSSQYNFTITPSGNSNINTTTRKYGSGSAFFDGTGDYLEAPLNSAFELGAEDFTLEAWVYPTRTGFHTCIAKWGIITRSYFLAVDTTTGIVVYLDSNPTSPIIVGGTIVANQWQHIAATRQGTQIKAFINGVQAGSTYNYGIGALDAAATTRLRIGGDVYGNTTFQGYMDEVRITKGVARYTSNFTPPPPFIYNIKPGSYIATVELTNYMDQTGVVLRLRNYDTGNVICQWTNTRIGAGNFANVAPQTAFRQTTGFTLANNANVILEVLGGSTLTDASVSDGDYQMFCQLTLDKIG